MKNLKETESQLKKSCGDHLAELDSHIADLESQLERERHISHAELAERRSELEKRHLLANEKLATLKKVVFFKQNNLMIAISSLSPFSPQLPLPLNFPFYFPFIPPYFPLYIPPLFPPLFPHISLYIPLFPLLSHSLSPKFPPLL